MDMLKRSQSLLSVLVAVALVCVSSCKDPYHYDDREPDWLGASIYDYLKSHRDSAGNPDYSYFVRIIDSCNYKDVLNRTGSKTMFVCKDKSFEEYFRNNDEGVTCFEDFTRSMLNRIMEYSMVNDANLVEMLSYEAGYVKGMVMRRETSLDPLDMLDFEKESLPAKNPYFAPYRAKGIYVLNDNTSPRLIHILQELVDVHNITDDDFAVLFNGLQHQKGDGFVLNHKIIERDITCKNGYIHVLDGLLLPRENMAAFIRKNSNLTVFNSLMDRFSAPYPDVNRSNTYRQLHPDFPLEDTIYVRRYFASLSQGGGNTLTPAGASVPESERLILDPGWNGYERNGNGRNDMAAIFVPNDQAMQEYFSPTGEGSYLYDRYHVWDSVPNDIACKFINAHMKYSFLTSLPSKFIGLKNEQWDEIGVRKEHVQEARVTTNGAVYVTNKVYPPVEYASVMAPVLVGLNTRVFNKGLADLNFDIYLKSMETVYTNGYVPPYTFIVPSDEGISNYIYPSSMGRPYHEVLDFVYNEDNSSVEAIRYQIDESDPGARVRVGSDDSRMSGSTITALMNEMLDYHIIIGELKPEQEYYQTKGMGYVRVQMTDDNNVKVWGGGNMEQNQTWGGSSGAWNDPAYSPNLTKFLNFRNGKTYMVDKVLQQPFNSVYKTLRSHSEFTDFLNACSDISDPNKLIFVSSIKNTSMIDQNVKFYIAYHYTLYVPNNAAMAKAYAAGLPTWTQINATSDQAKKRQMTAKMVDFLRYHFQDNSVFIKGYEVADTTYETSLINSATGKFYTLNVTQDGENLTLTPAASFNTGQEVPYSINKRGSVKVEKSHNLYNLMARDLYFSGANISNVSASLSDYSARTTVHELDTFLTVIKAPSLSFNYTATNKDYMIVLATTAVDDNGDGVVYNGTAANGNQVIIEKGLKYYWSLDPDTAYLIIPSSTEKKVHYWKQWKSATGTMSSEKINSVDVTATGVALSPGDVDPMYGRKLFYYKDGTKDYNFNAGRREIYDPVKDKMVSDSLLYVQAYAVSKYYENGTTTPTNATDEHLQAASKVICVNTNTGSIVK